MRYETANACFAGRLHVQGYNGLFHIRSFIFRQQSQQESRSKHMQKQISRRRTFAIISHPDAGKTTLTEKFLLYGGAVQLAGSVTAQEPARHHFRLDGA